VKKVSESITIVTHCGLVRNKYRFRLWPRIGDPEARMCPSCLWKEMNPNA
jgi:hypothetical protein